MLTFQKWVFRENTAHNITIDYSFYEKQITAEIEKINDFSEKQAADVEQTQFNPQLVANSAYPKKQELLTAFANYQHGTESEEHLDDLVSDFSRWVMDSNRKKYDPNLRSIWTHVTNYQAKLGNNYHHNPEQYENSRQQLIQDTRNKMEGIKAKVLQAIEGIPNWNGSPVKIIPQAGEDSYGRASIESGSEDCQIFVGNRYGMFSCFNHEGKMIIDDILEGGYEDEEFFDNDRVKADYYALINELRSPGSSNKGKILILYTARPTKDRDFFNSTTWLPINMFLTNSPDHAQGLAHDLGASEVRDVWKVKIDSKYLTQTLDGPVKYYMVSQDKSPIKSISLY